LSEYSEEPQNYSSWYWSLKIRRKTGILGINSFGQWTEEELVEI